MCRSAREELLLGKIYTQLLKVLYLDTLELRTASHSAMFMYLFPSLQTIYDKKLFTNQVI
jgi:hypothetical protein